MKDNMPDVYVELVERATRLAKTGDSASAVRAYRQATALDPQSPDAYLRLGLLQRAQGNTAEAIAALERAAQIRPNDPSAHNNLGVLYYEAGRLEEGEQSLRRAIEIAPGSIQAMLNLEKVQRRQIELSAIPQGSSEDGLVRVDLGCGVSKGDGFIGVDIAALPGVDVVCDVTKGIPFQDNSVDYLVADNLMEHVGDEFLEVMNDVWRVCKPTSRVLIIVPGAHTSAAFQDPTHKRFFVLETFDYFDVNHKRWRKFGSTYGIKPFAVLQRGLRQSNRIFIDVVLQPHKERRNTSPQMAALQVEPGAGLQSRRKVMQRTGALAEAGGEVEAARVHDQAVRVGEEDARACYESGLLHHQRGQVSDALACFEKASRLSPDDATIWNNLGVLYYAEGKLERAERALRLAVALDESYAEAWHNLGKVLLGQGKKQEAGDALRVCLRFDATRDKGQETLEALEGETALSSDERRRAPVAEKPALTICTVSFDSKRHLHLNWALTTCLNGQASFVWVVVENSDPGCERLSADDHRFVVLEGVPRPSAPEAPWATGSYHHGLGLNEASRHVHSRFALFLDPDFYLVRPEWIDDVLAHMLRNDLAFFGVPWHPRWYLKCRYFPCVHCLFVDLDKVPIESLDFLPQFGGEADERERVRRSEELQRHFAHLQRSVDTQNGQVMPSLHDLTQRLLIGSSRDTGYGLFREYGQNGQVHYECAVPVFRSRSDFRGPAHVLSPLGRAVEELLPDSLCYLPKQGGYYVEQGFRELNYPDVSVLGWEEFLWQGEPLGFHLRRLAQDKSNPGREIASLTRTLPYFVFGTDRTE